MTPDAAETLAIQALGFTAGEPARLDRFLALTGIGPESLRSAARVPGFLSGVLDCLASDESLLVTFAAEFGIEGGAVGARAALGGPGWEWRAP